MSNFVEIGQTTAKMWRFFKIAAVCHLGFVVRVIGPPTNVVWWSLSLCKICSESIQ